MLENHLMDAAVLLGLMAELNPYNIKILEGAGVSSLRADMLSEAERHLTKLAVGHAYKSLEDRSNAAVCFRRALKLNTDFEKAKHALAEFGE
jgi:hypothetical protein